MWYDSSSINKIHFATVIALIDLISKLGACPQDWTDAMGSCYMKPKDILDPVPWGVAQYFCADSDLRGRLPMFKDEMSWNVFQIGVKEFKTEINKTKVPDGFVLPDTMVPFGAYKKDGKFFWVDGTEMPPGGTSHWQAGQPDSKDDTGPEAQKCVGFNVMNGDTGYSDMKCGGRYLYVCQMEDGEPYDNPNAKSADLAPTGAAKPCAADWTPIGNSCFKVPSDNPLMPVDDGIAACTKLNPDATLPQFFIKAEFEKFLRYMSNNITNSQHMDIALGFRKQGDSFAATTKIPASYTHWGLKQPGAESCVAMTDINGFTWKSVDCKSAAFIVCQIDGRAFGGVAAGGGGGGGGSAPAASSGAAQVPSQDPAAPAGNNTGNGKKNDSKNNQSNFNVLLFLLVTVKFFG